VPQSNLPLKIVQRGREHVDHAHRTDPRRILYRTKSQQRKGDQRLLETVVSDLAAHDPKVVANELYRTLNRKRDPFWNEVKRHLENKFVAKDGLRPFDPLDAARLKMCEGTQAFVKRHYKRGYHHPAMEAVVTAAFFECEDEELVPGICKIIGRRKHQLQQYYHHAKEMKDKGTMFESARGKKQKMQGDRMEAWETVNKFCHSDVNSYLIDVPWRNFHCKVRVPGKTYRETHEGRYWKPHAGKTIESQHECFLASDEFKEYQGSGTDRTIGKHQFASFVCPCVRVCLLDPAGVPIHTTREGVPVDSRKEAESPEEMKVAPERASNTAKLPSTDADEKPEEVERVDL